MGPEIYENITPISEFSEAGRQTMSSGIASCSVRPIGNIEEEFGGNPHAQMTDEQDKLYDKLLEPFDERDEEGERDRVSTGEEHESTNEDDEQHSSEEAVKALVANVPKRPTQIEVDQHMTTHLPFRSWCPHCVRGKSKGRPHPRSTTRKEITAVVVDYMFMSESQEATEEKGMPILVMRDVHQDDCGERG